MKPNYLHSTKDYTKFELCQFNRRVERTKNLKESMRKHGFIAAYPIHCVKSPTGSLQIKDGHHRFEVAQELGLPVYYVVSNDDATLPELVIATEPWRQRNFLQSNVNCGKADYLELQKYQERTGLPLGCCASMLSGEAAGSNNKAKAFRAGEFSISDEGRRHAEAVAGIVIFCRDCGINTINAIFVNALSRCLFVKQFLPETFKKRCEANVAMFKKCRSIVEQTELFELVYNRNATTANRVPLAFLANQAMAQRAIANSPTGRG